MDIFVSDTETGCCVGHGGHKNVFLCQARKFLCRTRKQVPCWTRKCVSLSGMEVQAAAHTATWLSTLLPQPLPSRCRAAATAAPLSQLPSCCRPAAANHTTTGPSQPWKPLLRCCSRLAAAGQPLTTTSPPCQAAAPSLLVDDCHVPHPDSSALTPRPWQCNCSASTPPPHSLCRCNQTSITTTTLPSTLPRCHYHCHQAASCHAAKAAAHIALLPPPPPRRH